MRVFAAVPLDDETRHRLAHLVSDHVVEMPGRAVPPEKWHLTLRFLGELEEAEVDLIRHALDDADLGEAFPMAWGRLGAFPRSSRASVLWIGVARGEEPLSDVAAAVDDALESAGFDPEDRPFRPHLTIARMRPPEDVRPVVRGDPFPDVAMRIDRVTLYQSRLGAGGARYEVLDEFELSRKQ
ncbi:MAG TPA: RNA 2',3'-cyclic phosphodiesterase [Acidimicrobiia bacterium]|nr:RNA 2',3'-cyclic phosphodiesterase [Acidimicrobiia bacterium]